MICGIGPLQRAFQYEFPCRELLPADLAQFKGSLRHTLNPLTTACVAADPRII